MDTSCARGRRQSWELFSRWALDWAYGGAMQLEPSDLSENLFSCPHLPVLSLRTGTECWGLGALQALTAQQWPQPAAVVAGFILRAGRGWSSAWRRKSRVKVDRCGSLRGCLPIAAHVGGLSDVCCPWEAVGQLSKGGLCRIRVLCSQGGAEWEKHSPQVCDPASE